jgi:uncharacterized protein (TIGR03437 family)
MLRLLTSLTLLILLALAAPAATTNTTLTVDATGTLNATAGTFTASGTASLTGIGNGTFTATLSFASISGANVNAPFTITISGSTITGTITLPATLLLGSTSSGSGSATITGGTGTYAGATGSFPSLAGTATGAAPNPITMHFSGAGSITTGGSTGTGGTGTGGGGTATSVTITDVLDAGSYTKNIAQGSIFVVKGTNLSASGFTQASFPLPTTLANVSITVGSTAAYMIYDYNQGGVNQLAAVLPSTVAPGNYTLTVKSNTGDTGTAQVTVVQRKPGIITQDSTGSGLAVVQNFISQTQLDIDRFTVGTISGITISPARPGQVLIAWLTGLGPVTTGDNTASPGHDFLADSVDIQVIVGGRSIKPLYAGRAPGLAGADQINFILPADITTGCTVPFQVSVAGQLSNPSFVSIAPGSDNSCSAPGITTAQLQNFDQGKTLNVGAFTISQIAMSVQGFNVKVNTAGGSFMKISGFQLDTAGRYLGTATNGCQVIRVKGSQAQLANPVAVAGLDAGNITLTGPSGSGLTAAALTKDTSNLYSASLGTEGLGVTLPGQLNATLVPGTYTLNGAGGVDVGAFSASTTLASPLTITGGLPSTISRSSSLRLNWTGGGTNDMVTILGYSGTSTGTGSNPTVDAVEFLCSTTAGQGGFTVPADVLAQLPVTTGANATGFLEVFTAGTPSSFTAPLKAGGNIDSGTFSASSGTGAQVTYQ